MSRRSRIRQLSYSELIGFCKSNDFWMGAVSHPLAAMLSWGFVRVGVLPNTVTVMGVIASIGGAAAALYLGGGLWGAVAFAIGTQLGYALDGADGMIARAQGTSSKFGGWFDLTFDRIVHASVLCILMFIDLPAQGSLSDIAAHLAPMMLLLTVSLGYHNATNLRTIIFPRGKGGSQSSLDLKPGTAKALAKTLVVDVCDFGFFMFLLALGMAFGVLQWAVWLTIVTHTVALLALGVRVRQLSAEHQASVEAGE